MTHRNNQHTSRLRLRHPYLADMEQFRPPQQGGNEPLGADLFTMPKIPNIEKPYVPFHRDQYDQVLAAVKKQGLALKYASDRLKADPRIVETAVRQNGAALAYAPSNFRDDRTTVRAAVQQSGMALEFASPQFQKDRSIVLEAVADGELYIWGCNFGHPGSMNDLNILDCSTIVEDILKGTLLPDVVP